MSVTVRSMIIATILMLAAIIVYRISSLTGQLTSDEISSRYPTFEATDFTGMLFSKSGDLTHNIQAEHVTYYEVYDRIALRDLKITYHKKDLEKAQNIQIQNNDNEEENQSWTLSSNIGVLILDQYAELAGNIKVIPNFEESVIKEIKTPYLYFNILSEELSSPDSIEITGSQFKQTGSNYIIDLKKKTFVIKDHPHAVYYINSNNSDSHM